MYTTQMVKCPDCPKHHNEPHEDRNCVYLLLTVYVAKADKGLVLVVFVFFFFFLHRTLIPEMCKIQIRQI